MLERLQLRLFGGMSGQNGEACPKMQEGFGATEESIDKRRGSLYILGGE